jgi:DNA-binding XRE family transcriptional regulator
LDADTFNKGVHVWNGNCARFGTMLLTMAATVKCWIQHMATTAKNIVGPQVRRLRVAAGLSQAALAAACQRRGWDISRDSVAKIEGGTRWVCDVELVELAKAFKQPVSELFPLRLRSVARGGAK